jgi:hypothetical protein
MHWSLWSDGSDEYLLKRSAQMIKAGRLYITVDSHYVTDRARLVVQRGRLSTYYWRPPDAAQDLRNIERSRCQ